MGKAGRPRGRKNDKTLEKERVQEAVRQRIFKNADRIISAQLSLTQGLNFLYRINTEILKDGKKIKSKPVLVTDPKEIAAYLDGEFGDGESANTETEYYYMTSKEPNNMAATDLLNRGLGKPVEQISGPDGGPIRVSIDSFLNKVYGDNKSN